MPNENENGNDQNTNQNQNTSETGQNGNPTGQTGNNAPTVTYEDDGRVMVVDGKRFVVQDHVNQLVGNARTEGKNAGKSEAERAAEAARDAERNQNLAEQGQYKPLWEEEQRKREAAERRVHELEGQVQSAELDKLRAKVAKELNIPDAFIDRIRGDDEAAMRADAEEMAKSITPPKAPNTQTGNTGNSNANANANNGNRTPSHENQNANKGGKSYAFQSQGEIPW